MTTSDANTVKAYLTIEGVSDELYVIELKGKEGLCELYNFNVLLASESSSVTPEQVLGKTAVLKLEGAGDDRYVHGIIGGFQVRETKRKARWKFTTYQATIVPKAWRLTLNADCRIFQKKSAKQIISEVLKDESVEFSFKSKGGQEPKEREYCVQYRESDWAFVRRLLEDEGYFFFFEHAEDKHVLHMGNDVQHHLDIPGTNSLDFHEPDSRNPPAEHIFRLFVQGGLQPGKVTLSDFNYETPTLNMQAECETEGADTSVEVYDYPGKYDTPEAGKDKAFNRMGALLDAEPIIEGQSTCPRMVGGNYFEVGTFADCPGMEGNKYLLTSVVHLGQSTARGVGRGILQRELSYENEFQGLPRADAAFKPALVTPRPRIAGVQTAIVLGRGQEVDMDEQGRVHVKFFWDRRTDSSSVLTCWVRVAQFWAGQAWGAQFTPRAGHEVVVEFLEGDPDRPLITGSVYNAINPPPYPKDATKSAIKSRSTPKGQGFNEIRFEDKKGDEEFFTQAEKNQNETVKANLSTGVGGNHTLGVGNDETISVGNDQTITVGAKREVTIGALDKLTVGANRELDITANLKSKSGASTDVKAGTAVFVKAPLIQAKATDVEIDGSATITETSRVVTIKGSSQVDISGGAVFVTGKNEVKVVSGGYMEIRASTADASATTFNISGGTINIKGGTVNVRGGQIKLNC